MLEVFVSKKETVDRGLRILKLHFMTMNFFYFFACRILVPQLGIESMRPVVEVQSLNNWTTREFPNTVILFSLKIQEIIIILLNYKIGREREKCEWKALFSSRMPTNKYRKVFDR